MKYRITLLFGAFVALSLTVGCGDDSTDDTANNTISDPRVRAIVALEGDASEGQSDFDSVCVTCHGTDGTGVGNLGNDLTASTLSRAEVVDTIINGRGTMVGYDTAFSDQEVADIAAYALDFRE